MDYAGLPEVHRLSLESLTQPGVPGSGDGTESGCRDSHLNESLQFAGFRRVVARQIANASAVR